MLDNTCFAYFHVYSIQGIVYFKCNSQGVLLVCLLGLRVFCLCGRSLFRVFLFYFVGAFAIFFFFNLLHFEANQNPIVTTK